MRSLLKLKFDIDMIEQVQLRGTKLIPAIRNLIYQNKSLES